jgi:7-cyano-7-deazaguanine synthase
LHPDSIDIPTEVPPGDEAVGLLFSGGMESSVLLSELLLLGRVAYPVFVHADLPWEDVALQHANRLLARPAFENARPLRLVRMSGLYSSPPQSFFTGKIPSGGARPIDSEIRARNLILITAAFTCLDETGASTLVLGTSPPIEFPDNSGEFFKGLKHPLEISLKRPVSMVHPFYELEKHALIARRPDFPWQDTFSCFDPVAGLHCGRCYKCESRRTAFVKAGVTDPTHYADHP